jgi:hypothetical protein
MIGSTPTLAEFVPLQMQAKILRDIANFDYSLGTHEILLSGSIGCLREDALVQTASGLIPISDIDGSKPLLSFHGKTNQFALTSSSAAFPKGKDYLYRVIGEHGEFVASGHHLLATSPYTYSKVSDLALSCSPISTPHVLLNERHAGYRLLLREDVLRCSHTLLNLLGHCAKHIRQCDLQLLQQLNNVLEFFPSQGDAQEYGLFFCLNKFLQADVRSEQELEPYRNVESPFHQSTRDLIRLLAHGTLGEVDVYTRGDLKLYSRKLSGILQSVLFVTHTAHPQDLRSFLSYLLPALIDILSVDVSYTNSTILKIERLDKEEWYWDIQVPNTHNYVANGYQHHNSAKSILLAHVAIRHAVENIRANIMLGRRALPDLKDTLYKKIIEHLGSVDESYYDTLDSTARINFRNGSSIISRSWADKHYSKLRSLELSLACFEELTENNDEESQAYVETSFRLGRLPHIKTPLIISATNPGSPSHWVYKRFIEPNSNGQKHPTRHVYYSRTEDNPYLPPQYIEQLKRDLDPKMARRMLYGEWLEIREEVIYYEYDSNKQYSKEPWKPREETTVIISFDFNIGLGKPMSAVAMCYQDEVFHIFHEVIVEGARTDDIMDEFFDRGIIKQGYNYEIDGDASGSNRSTSSKRSDYDIIRQRLDQEGIRYTYKVRRSNPPVRQRHNLVNAYCKNSLGQTRLFVHNCKTVDEGLRLTALKKGSGVIEDDSKPYQHVTTAIGYAIVRKHHEINRDEGNSTIL